MVVVLPRIQSSQTNCFPPQECLRLLVAQRYQDERRTGREAAGSVRSIAGVGRLNA